MANQNTDINIGTVTSIKTPYLIYLGDERDKQLAKTAFGLRDWARDKCVGQFRSCKSAVDLGLEEMSFEDAVRKGAKSLIIGLATDGGDIPLKWQHDLKSALEAGLDIAAGMHTSLKSIPALVEAAKNANRQLIDIRETSKTFPIATGKKRTGKRLLTVGTDCALGKKYTALAIAQALQERNHLASFRATGQTGIMIAGQGIPIDSVVCDFLAGAAETLSPDNDDNHWDIIEGQGSLFHPSYASVSLGLLHGSQPDAIIMCHDPSRSHIEGLPQFLIPSIPRAISHTLECARLTNPSVTCIGVSVNTSTFSPQERSDIIAKIEDETDLPCSDPIAIGVDAFVDALLNIK